MNDSPLPSPPSTPSHLKTNLPMLYYGLVVVGVAAVVLATYNLLVMRWCTNRHSAPRPNQFRNSTTVSLSADLVSSTFKYKKEQNEQHQECAVCLSIFEEGEEVRLLPRCLHSFHAQCIDMWLYSHSDCPLCRAPVRNRTGASPLRRREDIPMMTMQSNRRQRAESEVNSSVEYSSEGLLNYSNIIP